MKRQDAGEPILFRLKKPDYAIAGFGFFVHFEVLDLETAWATFGWKNGDPDKLRFFERIGGYRGVDLLDPRAVQTTLAHFPAETCGVCPIRRQCTDAAPSRGRAVSIAPDEPLQKGLRAAISKPAGRERLRERVKIEHRLSHHARKQGLRARYLGVRNNVFDSRRHAATVNLEKLQAAEAA